jgi:6-pyruvoyltetrahydropterin/6-carboxytetrahydropterin synthase
MWEITRETTIGAAHRLRFTKGEGERLHGHNWTIKAVVRARELDAQGMVLDFAVLGAALRSVVEPYEHVFLNEVAPFDDVNPTAENLARVVADAVATQIDDDRVKLVRVEVWEDPVSCAIYHRP